jgi:hypothetical protein
LGIKDLAAPRVSRGMPIDDLLEGLNAELREHLQRVIMDRQPDGTFSVPRDEIIRACAEDGFIVTDWSIRMYRKRNGDS